MVFDNDDSDAMYFKMIHHAESIVVDVFGARYVRNHPTPSCIYDAVGDYFSTKDPMDEEAEECPDEELVSRSVEGSDFLTQSWQNP